MKQFLYTDSLNTDIWSAQIDLDVTRLADRIKNTRAQETDSLEDLNLLKYFQMPELGLLTEPAVIVDKFGKIVVWYLPDILYSQMTVSFFHFSFLYKDNTLIWFLLHTADLQFNRHRTQKQIARFCSQTHHSWRTLAEERVPSWSRIWRRCSGLVSWMVSGFA